MISASICLSENVSVIKMNGQSNRSWKTEAGNWGNPKEFFATYLELYKSGNIYWQMSSFFA
jgi:hypothetical protein